MKAPEAASPTRHSAARHNLETARDTSSTVLRPFPFQRANAKGQAACTRSSGEIVQPRAGLQPCTGPQPGPVQAWTRLRAPVSKACFRAKRPALDRSGAKPWRKVCFQAVALWAGERE